MSTSLAGAITVSTAKHSDVCTGHVSGEFRQLFLGSLDGECRYLGDIFEGGVRVAVADLLMCAAWP